MTAIKVVHVVRRYGGVTEPFIEQRVRASGEIAELWYERLDGAPPFGATRQITVPLIRPGSLGDRVYHRWPAVGLFFGKAYTEAERAAKPQVIHAHYLTTGYLVGSLTRAPLVISTYGFDVTVMPRRTAWRRAIRRLVPRVNAVLVEGPFMRRTVMDLGFSADRIHVVPIAASLDRIAYRDPSPGRAEPRIVVCGRLVEKKGHDLALRAFACAADTLPRGAILEIIGDGPRRSSLKRLAVELGVADRVRFWGALSRPEYLQRLSEADLLIAPSRTAPNGDGEGGAPTTILDAQARGVISVGSTHGDIPFLIRDGETGYLVEEGSVEALAEGLRRAFASTDQWISIARRARRQVEDRHADATVAGLLKDIHQMAASL